MEIETSTLLIVLLVIVACCILFIMFRNSQNTAQGAYERVMALTQPRRIVGGDNRHLVEYLKKIKEGLCSDPPVLYTISGSLDIEFEAAAVKFAVGRVIRLPEGPVFVEGTGFNDIEWIPIPATPENIEQIRNIVFSEDGIDPENHVLNPMEDNQPGTYYKKEIRDIMTNIRQCFNRITIQAEQEVEREAEQAQQAEAEREQAERQAAAERAAREQVEQEAREQAEQQAREQAEQQAREQAEQQAAAERAAREQAERAAREQAERAAREQAERAARERQAAQQAAERAARERQAAQQAAERAAREQAEQEAREQAERAARERQAAQQAAERAARDAARRGLDVEEDEELEYPEAVADSRGKEFYDPAKAAAWASKTVTGKDKNIKAADKAWHSDKGQAIKSTDAAIHGNNPT